MSHTPGPWTADWDDSGQWYVNIGGLCVSGNALRGDSEECVESANARLIAAAPDLLAALKLLPLEAFDEDMDLPWRIDAAKFVDNAGAFFEAMQAARAAIAKAASKETQA